MAAYVDRYLTEEVRALRRLPPVHEASADFGEFYEHYVLHELRT